MFFPSSCLSQLIWNCYQQDLEVTNYPLGADSPLKKIRLLQTFRKLFARLLNLKTLLTPLCFPVHLNLQLSLEVVAFSSLFYSTITEQHLGKSSSVLQMLLEHLFAADYSKASLVTQMVKNPPAMWQTWIQSLGCEHPLKEGIHTAVFLPIDRGTWWAAIHGITKSWTRLNT